jgi:hypothetical protein
LRPRVRPLAGPRTSLASLRFKTFERCTPCPAGSGLRSRAGQSNAKIRETTLRKRLTRGRLAGRRTRNGLPPPRPLGPAGQCRLPTDTRCQISTGPAATTASMRLPDVVARASNMGTKMEHVNSLGAGRLLIGGARVKQSVPQKRESAVAEIPLPMRQNNQQKLTQTPNSYDLRVSAPPRAKCFCAAAQTSNAIALPTRGVGTPLRRLASARRGLSARAPARAGATLRY